MEEDTVLSGKLKKKIWYWNISAGADKKGGNHPRRTARRGEKVENSV
jgi:hypothetical protein